MFWFLGGIQLSFDVDQQICRRNDEIRILLSLRFGDALPGMTEWNCVVTVILRMLSLHQKTATNLELTGKYMSIR